MTERRVQLEVVGWVIMIVVVAAVITNFTHHLAEAGNVSRQAEVDLTGPLIDETWMFKCTLMPDLEAES